MEVQLARDTMEARLALAVNHAPIVIWTADRDGIVRLSEGAGLASMGATSGQLVGQNLFDLYRDHPTIPGHIRRGLAGESFWYTVEVPGAIYDTYLTPLRDADGKVTGVAALSNDVTELRQLQANAIQNDLGGEIAVEDAPRGGARFRVTLPAHDAAPAAPAAPKPASVKPKPVERAQILLVDDEPLLLRALSNTLRNVGHEITAADDGASALEILLSSQRFDLVFCDVMMRGMTGMELLKILKERAPHRVSRIVFMSGGAYTPEARAFLDQYSEQSVDKPFDPVREARARLQRFAQESL